MIEWRPIPDFEDLYEVSYDGRVRRLHSVVRVGKYAHREIEQHELKPFEKKKGSGYLYVRLSRKRKTWMKSVSELVDVVWKGKKPKKVHENPGIYKRKNRWYAQGYNTKVVFLGSFVKKEDAIKAKHKFEMEKAGC